MRILIGDPDIQARMALQKYLGTFGDCQTVDSADALIQVFRNSVSSHDEAFGLVVIDANLGPAEELFEQLKTLQWEANMQHDQGCILIFTGTMLEWMRICSQVGDSCDTFLAKPIKRDLLYATMGNLGFEHIRKKTPQAAIDRIVRDYFASGGEVLVLCEEGSFFTMLRNGVDSIIRTPNTILHFTSPDEVATHLAMPIRAEVPVMLFVARTLSGKLSTQHIHALRKVHHKLKVIVLARESEDTEDCNIAYLHDMEADNVLTLPASINNAFEKMANTLHPPARLQSLMQEARDSLGRGDYPKTLALLDEALTMKPYSPGVLLLKGDVHREMGDTDAAITAYEEAHFSSSLFLDPLKRLAEIYQKRSPQAALPYLEKLDAISPRNARRKVELGNAKLETEGIEVSRRHYDEGISLARKESGRLVDELVNIISEALRFKFPKAALEYVDGLIHSKRGKYTLEDVETFNRRGVLLRQEGNWKEAIDNYRKALTIAPDQCVLKYNLMMALMEGRDFRAALTEANEIMQREPAFARSSANVAFNLAQVYERQGYADQAHQLANMALRVDPGHGPTIELKRKIHRERTQ